MWVGNNAKDIIKTGRI
ncbi:unnamed protein product [Debaryomyces tyrocola]|nr:unnamed protein product [Debaryomyces tyrocola]